MRNMKWMLASAVLVVILLLGVQLVVSQEPAEKKTEKETKAVASPTPTGRPERARPGAMQFEPGRMLPMMLERNKEALGATEEEWKKIEPLLKKVLETRMEARGGGFGRRRPESAVAFPEEEALKKAIEAKDTPAEEIKAKLTAYREARQKKEEAYKKACEELKKVLTPRQEAILVLQGTLD